MSEFKLQFSLGTDSLCNGCPALHWRASDACYLCGVEKRRVHSGIAIDGINRTDWCPLQKASDAEAALKEKDARIAELESQLKEGTEDGSRCNRRCEGVMVLGQPVDCSCHLSAPCVHCEENRPECSMCGWEARG